MLLTFNYYLQLNIQFKLYYTRVIILIIIKCIEVLDVKIFPDYRAGYLTVSS